MAPPARTRKLFDLERFQQMIEPFTVRVERLEGSARSPIPLPPSRTGWDNYDPNRCTSPITGWTNADVAGLEQWLITEWSGGGFYSISIVDANNTSMEWEANFDPAKYPKQIPPPLRSGANASATPPSLAPSPPTTSTQQILQGDPWWTSGFYPSHVYSTQPQPVTAPSIPMQQGAAPMSRLPWYQPVSYVAPPPSNSNGRDRERELEMEARQTRSALEAAQRELDRQKYEADLRQRDTESKYQQMLRDMESKANAELSALRTGFDRQIAEFKEQMRDMKAAAERPTVDVEARFEKLIDQVIKPLLGNKDDDRVRRLEEQMQRERDERARIDRENQTRAEIQKMEARMERMMEQLTAAQKDRGPDPMLQLMQTTLQTQMEAMRQQTAQQQISQQQLMNLMTPPHQLVAMMKDASNGTDQMMRNVTGAFSSVFDLMREGISNVMQLSGGGNDPPWMRMAENVLEKGGTALDRWVNGQNAAQVAQAKVQQSYIDAQAEVARAQADALAAQAQAQASAAATAQANAAGQWATHTPSAPPAQPQIAPGNGAAANGEPKRGGMTDVQWFGPALEDVQQLRAAVAAYVDATKERPYKRNDKGEVLGAPPALTARFLIQAVQHIKQAGIDINALPAFRLFLDERYADLLDLLLPSAPQSYRDEVVKALTRSLDPAAAVMEENDAEEEDEDEEEEDEKPSAPVPASPAAKPNATKPAGHVQQRAAGGPRRPAA